jgi:hypothetical protein
MKHYIIHWLNGQTEQIYGETFDQALHKAAISNAEFMMLLDYYEEAR